MKRHPILAAVMMAIYISAAASAQTNVLVNGDFESNPPPNLGNNIGYSIAPWVLGPGNKANVVGVDGPGGFDYGSDGPESDASAPGAGVPQHYLDIVQGSNDFYQSFTPQCSGNVVFGGSFSTRANSPGTATVTLREGVGTSGNIVGQSNAVSLSGGNSRTDPWTPVSFTAHINALATYSFVVHMDNNMNFDNGFARFELACNPPDPCCPPWNSTLLEDMLVYQGSGSIAAPYTLRFIPATLFKSQIQAYIDYLHVMNPSITAIIIAFELTDAGTGVTPSGGPQVGNVYYIGWVAGGGGNPIGATNFFTLATEPMQVNRWYRINTSIFLNGNLTFFPLSCAYNKVDVRIQVQKALGRLAGPVLQIRKADGRIVEKRLTSINE